PWESQWHADLDPANLTVLLPQPSATYAGFATASDIDHGTATSTILFGRQENADPTLGPGVTGAVPYATGFLVPIVSSAGSDIPGALLAAQAQLGAGDVVQMALQTMFMGAYRPVTVDPNVAMTVAMLDAAGIHVVHAAGNSGVDVTEFTQPSGLGHAVGAFDWTTGHAEPFSNQSKDIIFGAQGSNVVAGGYGFSAPERARRIWSTPRSTAGRRPHRRSSRAPSRRSWTHTGRRTPSERRPTRRPTESTSLAGRPTPRPSARCSARSCPAVWPSSSTSGEPSTRRSSLATGASPHTGSARIWRCLSRLSS
ncbi:MAG: hypothetical protein AAFP86_16950, partial [Planctomycetota bacterium]